MNFFYKHEVRNRFKNDDKFIHFALLFSAHLNYLMEENDDAMILPDEYIDMYEKPFDVTLESGEYSH